jgi:hypothetical protein
VTAAPNLAPHEGSWIVVRKGTLDAVCELWTRAVAEKVNRAAYDVLTAGDYLGRFNATVAH